MGVPGADEPLAWFEGSGTGNRRFFVSDERGSVVLITNNSGGTITQNKYDEYGVPDAGNSGRFGYTGQMKINGTNLWHYKARAYNPKLGLAPAGTFSVFKRSTGSFDQPSADRLRSLTAHPIGYGDGLNMCAYVGNDPVNMVDLSGLKSSLTSNTLRQRLYYRRYFTHSS